MHVVSCILTMDSFQKNYNFILNIIELFVESSSRIIDTLHTFGPVSENW